MNVLIAFVLMALSNAPALAQNEQTTIKAASDKVRLEAARELLKVFYELEQPETEAAEKPTGGDAEKRNPLFTREFFAKFQNMYEPVTEEARVRRDDIIAIYLSQKFSASESRAIADYVRSNVGKTITAIEMNIIHEGMAKCGFKPSFAIEIDEPLDKEKLMLARQLTTASPFNATGLGLLACGSLLLEYNLARQLTADELNSAIAFETSEAGRKYNALIQVLRSKQR